jgi:capsular polysaccharide biosynthesis protein
LLGHGLRRALTTRVYGYLKTRPRARVHVVNLYKRFNRAFARTRYQRSRSQTDPERAASTAAWLEEWNTGARPPALIVEAGESEEVANRPPTNLHGSVDYQHKLVERVRVPAPFVVEIPDGHAVGEHGAVVTPDHKLLTEVSWPVGSLRGYLERINGDTPGGDEFYIDSRLPGRRVGGTAAVLSAFVGRGYFHWMFDVLPRLGLLQKAGYRLEDIDYFLVPMRVSGFHYETLDSLGISEVRVLSSFHERHVVADRLLVPSLPRSAGVVPTWVVDYLGGAFPPVRPNGSEHPTRLYIVRRATDHGIVGNEDRLLDGLRRFGFEQVAMEDYTVREKAWLLGQAEAIIGASGAGLSNIVFCRPGTKIVELRVQPYPVMEPWDIANRVGLDFYDVLPEPQAGDDKGVVGIGSISEEAVLATLELAGLTSRASK